MTSAAQRRSLEEAIVDTVREPLIVLDDALRVLVASRSFWLGRWLRTCPRWKERAGMPCREMILYIRFLKETHTVSSHRAM